MTASNAAMQQGAGQDPRVLFQDFHGDVHDARHAGHHLGIMIVIRDMLTMILEKNISPSLTGCFFTVLFHFDPLIGHFSIGHFPLFKCCTSMGSPKTGLKSNEERRCKYVESERDQSDRWFFS